MGDMIERKIKETKDFMRKLLTESLWDEWLLTEAVISCDVNYTIDGQVNREYYGEDEENVPAGQYVRWERIRPVALSLIRGKHTPLFFRFTLRPPQSVTGASDDTGIDRSVRLCFREGALYAASAVSLREFTLDKEPERAWDAAFSHFLTEHGIDHEEL